MLSSTRPCGYRQQPDLLTPSRPAPSPAPRHTQHSVTDLRHHLPRSATVSGTNATLRGPSNPGAFTFAIAYRGRIERLDLVANVPPETFVEWALRIFGTTSVLSNRLPPLRWPSGIAPSLDNVAKRGSRRSAGPERVIVCWRGRNQNQVQQGGKRLRGDPRQGQSATLHNGCRNEPGVCCRACPFDARGLSDVHATQTCGWPVPQGKASR